MTRTIHNQLDQFINEYLSYHQKKENTLLVPYDSEWPSPCYKARVADGQQVEWQPQRQSEQHSFENVESAMGITLNHAYCQFFTRYYSNNLTASAQQGPCELLQVWNQNDFERLQQNLIGHLLMKKRLKQAPTLFFALTDEDDFVLSVLNETGEVVLEQVGRPPKEIISPSLGDFIATLSPR